MTRNVFFILSFSITFSCASGQTDDSYLKAHAVRINNPEKLSDSVYTLLSPFQIIMFGEMHGTNESAPFAGGLADLLTNKGDSVQVGLEIPSLLMAKFQAIKTDSSIYQSDFFQNPPYLDGKESVPWATLISKLNKNLGVNIFFFDVNDDEKKPNQRDSIMYSKIAVQFKKHPTWKMVTLSGNFHNRITNETTMTSFLIHDKELNLANKICSLNMEYYEGTCMANFGKGLEEKHLFNYPSVYNSTPDYDQYVILLSAKSNYPYTGFYYTKYITAAKMTTSK